MARTLSLTTLLAFGLFVFGALGEDNQKTLVWSDGTRYVGEVVDRKRHGKGTIYWKDGTRFVGEFKNDLRDGPGSLILPDGTVYNGVFVDDELIDSTGAAESVATEAQPRREPTPASTDVASVAPSTAAEPVREAQAEEPAAVRPQPTPPREPARPKPEVAAVATPPAAERQSPTASDEAITVLSDAVQHELQATVDEWAAAWSNRNVERYLAAYDDDFRVPNRLSRRDWEVMRKSRITRPKRIEVKVVYSRFEIVAPDQAEVAFKQSYRSNLYRDETNKVLKLIRRERRWRILEETSS